MTFIEGIITTIMDVIDPLASSERGTMTRTERLRPKDIRNKQFSTTRLRPGYDEEEVDAFLDELEDEVKTLRREVQDARTERNNLRNQLKSMSPNTN